MKSRLVVFGPVVKVSGSFAALTGVEAEEVLSSVSAVDVNVSAAEMIGPVHVAVEPAVNVGSRLKIGSVDEVICSVDELFVVSSEALVG